MASAEPAEDELSQNPDVEEHLVGSEELGEARGTGPPFEELHPDRGVDENHRASPLEGGRRRGGAATSGSFPWSAAKRRRAACFTRASKPIRTAAVLVGAPLTRMASATSSESISIVVRMQTESHISYASSTAHRDLKLGWSRRQSSAIASRFVSRISQLRAEGLVPAPIVADAGYGVATEFRQALTGRGLVYAVAVTEETSVWPPGQEPLPPLANTSRGARAKLLRRTAEHHPVSVRELAAALPAESYETVRWREGTRGRMASRFAAVRVRPAHRDTLRSTPHPVEWLLIEWPKGETKPSHYWLSTVPESATIEDLVRIVQVRWRIERDFQELKDEIGLDHYEGRSWPGFHHHGVLSIAAYAFLAAERARLSPPLPVAFLRAAPLPDAFRPRGAAAAP